MAFLPSLGFLGFEIDIFYCNTPCLVWLPMQRRRKTNFAFTGFFRPETGVSGRISRLLEGLITHTASFTTLDQAKRNQEYMWQTSQSLNKDLDDVLLGSWEEDPDMAFRVLTSFRTFFGYLSNGMTEVGG